MKVKSVWLEAQQRMTTESNLETCPKTQNAFMTHGEPDLLTHAGWRSDVSLCVDEVLNPIPSVCHSTLPFPLLHSKRLTRSTTRVVQALIRNDLGCQVTSGEAFYVYDSNIEVDRRRSEPLEDAHV